jgi:hypothetical protein
MDPDIDKLKDRAKYMVCIYIYMYRYGFEEMLLGVIGTSLETEA